MWFTVPVILVATLIVSDGSLTFVQNPVSLVVQSDFPVGAAIYRVVAVDEATGNRARDLNYRLVRISSDSDLGGRRSSSLYDDLFVVDRHTGTVLLSPHSKEVTLRDFEGINFRLEIGGIHLRKRPKKGNGGGGPMMILTLRVTGAEVEGDSCKPKEELCFQTTEYRFELPETTEPGTVIGNLKPPAPGKHCSGIRNSYTLTPGPLEVDATSGELRLVRSLDFESKHREHNQSISCRSSSDVENSTVAAIFGRTLSLRTRDVNDNPPYLQRGAKADIELDAADIRPGDPLPAQFVVLDDDTARVNHITRELVDPLGQLQLRSPIVFTDVEGGKMVFSTAVVAKKDFSFDGPYYNFSLIFRDKSVIGAVSPEVAFHVSIKNKTTAPSEIPEDCHVVWNISKHVGLYARISQPMAASETDGNHFQLVTTPFSDAAFAVTNQTGIVFVRDEASLAANVTYDLVLIRKSSSSEQRCRLTVHVIDDGNPSLECVDVSSDLRWPTCARHDREESCVVSCGRGSADGFCRWRAAPAARARSPTSRYATCSPDLATCPDGHCDELEGMDPSLCPQDCASEVHGEGFLSHLKRGIGAAAAPCTCEGLHSCLCNHLREDPEPYEESIRRERRQKMKERMKQEKTSSEPHVDEYEVNRTCDSSCVAVIASISTVVASCSLLALLVLVRHVRAAHLDKHRYVSNRVPLTAVLSSDYVDDSDRRNRHHESSVSTAAADAADQEKPLIEAKWEFRRDRLILQETLGEGEFGKVLKAQAWNIDQRPGFTTVAVKMLKANGSTSEEQDLLSELNMLREVSHPNVIQLLGACTTKGGPLCVIVEYAELGSLQEYLRKNREAAAVTSSSIDNPSYFDPDNAEDQLLFRNGGGVRQELISFSWQIAKGMAYLSDMKLVHRDLATRNILLSQSKVVKISDFGLSRDVYLGDTYLKTTKGRVPVKWMAIESLEDHIYTIKSDVWSFGIVLWEIITLGASPYPGITPERLYLLLKEGYRMPQPDACPNKLYKIMKKCWRAVPQERPSFKELVEKLDKMLQDRVEYLPLSPGEEDTSNASQYETPVAPIGDNHNPDDGLRECRSSSKLPLLSPFPRTGGSSGVYETSHLLSSTTAESCPSSSL